MYALAVVTKFKQTIRPTQVVVNDDCSSNVTYEMYIIKDFQELIQAQDLASLQGLFRT